VRRAWLRISLRARLMVIGVLGVAAALAIGSVTLYVVLTVVSYRALDQAGAATAAEVASLVDGGRLPDPLPVTGSQIVQVVDSRDRVVSASVSSDRLTALLLPAEAAAALAGSHVVVPGSRVGLDSDLRVVAVRAGPPGSRRTVVVAQQFEDIEHSQRILRVTLLSTYPLLLAVLTLIAWRVVGSALRPVESLRASAERISGTGQDDRLPVPASGDEIHALAVTLNSMLDRLSAARSREQSFVADAAHELRSPLASMQTQLEVAHRLGEDTPVTDDLHAEVLRMARLVEDLLALARLDAGRRSGPPPTPVGLRGLVREVSARFDGARVPVGTRGVDDVEACCRPDDLRRALANLLENAVRHARTAVEVQAHVEGAWVLVSVSDDGSGIPPEQRDRVLERFTRLDEARDRDAGGSGLGLAIVRELVRAHGGEVRILDGAQGGVRVELSVPAAPAPGGQLAEEVSAPSSPR
jgi:signal transduction histidine kinase